jgi:hypothetical protein
MINCKVLEGNGYDLNEGGTEVNCVRIVGVPAEIRTERRYTNLFDHTCIHISPNRRTDRAAGCFNNCGDSK